MKKVNLISSEFTKVVILILVAFLFVYSCSSDASSPKAKPEATTYTVTLVCEECVEIGMEINLWSTPSRSGVKGSVPHDTTATVLETSIYQGVLHYKVNARGITGWVSESFVKK